MMTEDTRLWKTPRKKVGGWDVSSWRMEKPEIDNSLCIKCDNCIKYCPELALNRDKQEYPKVDFRFCKGCGICSNQCPVDAIQMVADRGENDEL